MMKSRKSILLLVSVAALMLSAIAAASASASPEWKFNGSSLSGKETIVGAAISSSMTIPGLTTECKHFLYNMKISNAAGKGTGEITELPLYECITLTKTCTVESIAAKSLPWPTHLVTVEKENYLFIEKIEVEIVYGGALCAFEGTPIIVTGTAGGLIENSAQSAKFNKETFKKTGAVLKVAGNSIEWNGLFPTEGFEAHREQTLEVA
jgi:hypothetical protein